MNGLKAWLMAALFTLATAPAAWSAETQAADAAAEPGSGGEATETIVWRGVPIPVDLHLGAERIVALPGAHTIRAGLLGGPVPGLRIQVLGNRAYLLAKKPFAATRLLLQADNGQSVLLDLAADKRFPAGPALSVLTPTTAGAQAPVAQTPQAPSASPTTAGPQPVGYVALVRHAAQSLYAPPRLIPRSRAIVRAPLRIRESIPLLRGGAIEATPVASWRANGPDGPLWITACRLQNRTNDPVILDPRDLRGAWLAASFQHARLSPHGKTTDTTTAYVVSSRRFGQAIGAWLAEPRSLASARTGGSPR